MSLNYTSYNFTSIVTQLRDILKQKDPIWDSFESSTTTTLIELFSYVGEMLMYTAERRAQESFISTAQLKSSVINIVRLVNYQPRRKVSSTGTLQFTISAPIAKNIYIPKYTSVSSTSNIEFLTSTDTILFAGNTTVSVDGVQGKLITDTFISDGSDNQDHILNDTDVENTNIFVNVGSVQWTLVSSFVESQADSTVYRILTNNDETVTIRFGNNRFGQAPPENVTVTTKYIQSEGSDSNIFSTAVITAVNSTIYDEDGNVVTPTVTNTSLFLGGDDSEDIESIRFNAPRIFSTAERAVTRNDYIAVLEDYPSVAAVNVWGENEENPPNQNYLNKIRISVLLDGWNLAGTTFKQTLSTFLKTKATLTVQYDFVDPEICELVATVSASTSANNSLATVESSIESSLDSEFALGSVDIGETIRYADVVQAIEEASGVLYSFVTLQFKQSIGTGDGSTSLFSDTLQMIRVKDSSVQIYRDETLIGYTSSVDGQTTTVDSSSSAMIVTMNSMVLNTKFFKFGVASARFNGINSYMSMPDHTGFNLSGGIWTIDLEVRPDLYQPGTLYYQRTDANNYFRVYTTNGGAVGLEIISSGSTVVSLATPDAIMPLNEFTQIEVVEDGDSYYIFINGSPVVTSTDTDRPANYTGVVEIGRDGSSGHYFSGHIDEIRVSKAAARNVVNFTPYVVAFTPDSTTTLLLHLNGTGVITSIGGSAITGTVDYAYGTISVQFPSALTTASQVIVLYEQGENNFDLVPSKGQIVRLVEKTISVTYAS